ncbi:cell wall-binding repeat-containing protein [Rossellomorea arthrocnemi]
MMKKVLTSLIFTGLILFISFSHYNVAKAAGEVESNNTIQTATKLNLNTNYTGTIQSYDDVDYYKFNLSKAGNVTISADLVPEDGWRFELMDKNGNTYTEFISDYDSFVSGTEDVDVGLPAGEYYVKVVDQTYSVNVPYNFQVKFKESNYYEKEFNNTLQTANTVELNKSYEGSIQDVYGDADWYQFNLTKPGNVSFKIDRVVGSSWDVEILDGDGNTFTSVYTKYDNYANGQEVLDIGLPSGKYFIKITNNNYGTRTPYKFSVDFKDSNYFEKEFNNSLSTANQIEVNKQYQGVLQDKYGEADFYKFSIEKAGNTTIEVDRVVGSSWDFEVLDKNGNQYTEFHTQYDSYADGQATVDLGLPAGEFFIKVTNYSGSTGVGYKFKVNYEQNDHFEKEFNDSIQTATPIKWNKEYKGTIQDKYGEVDYYKLTLSQAENLVVSMKRNPDASWKMLVIDKDGKEYVKSYSEYGDYSNGTEISEIGLGAGTYYVVISNYSYSTNVPYTFKVQQKAERIQGPNRYETAIEISKQGWNTADTVVLAKGSDFPDALAGGPLAFYHNAPILLTDAKSLTGATKKEISRLKAKKVIILGSEGAVSKAVENELRKMGVSIQRIGGKDRFDTAAKIAKEIPATKVIIANGKNFPDALAVAPYASKNKYPILLTNADVLPSSTKAALSGKKNSIIVGSTTVVSDGVKKQLPNPVRYGGKDRYETAKLIIQNLPLGKEIGYVATGTNFPDALAGSVLAAKNNAPILLVKDKSIPSPTKSILNGYNQFKVWGGTAAISNNVVTELNNRLGQID